VAVLLLVLAALLAAGCSGSSKPTAVAQPPPSTTEPAPPTTVAPTTTTSTTTPPPPTYPLTGRPVTDAGKAARAAVAVKIDNIADARPQSGIGHADVVYEEFTEGITRFIVVFQSDDAEVVGPVRSVRPADPVVVTPLGGVLAFSGGSPGAEALARAAPLTIVTENDTAVMYRRSFRVAPHNLYTSTGGLFSRVPPEAGSPRAFSPFLKEGENFFGPGVTAVSSLHVVPAPQVVADYEWDATTRTWARFTDGVRHVLEDGQIGPTTVIVQFTPYSTFIDDDKVIYPEVVGSGEAWVLASGQMVKGTWTKDSPDAVTRFTNADGAPIVLPPGQTWVHLVAPGSSVTTG
jgi:hypothetical protein